MKQSFDVLVIEDEPIVIEGARRVLAPEGFTLDYAVDAESAVGLLARRSYRLVLCDLMLPGTSGFELVERLCDELQGTPVVVITGYASQENAIGALNAGAFDFLPKPFAVEELLGVVRRGLEHGAYRRPRGVGDVRDLHLLGGHSWARIERDGSARLGVGETFRSMPEIAEVEQPSPGEELVQGRAVARLLDREGCVHHVWSPLSGHLLEIHPDSPALRAAVRNDRYGEGWLVRISPGALDEELKSLLPAAAGGRP